MSPASVEFLVKIFYHFYTAECEEGNLAARLLSWTCE